MIRIPLSFGVALATVLLAAALPARAQQVSVRVAADSLDIGGRTTVTVRLTHDGSRRVVFPDEAGARPPEALGTLGDLELLVRLEAGFRSLPDGSRLDSVVYEATTFAVDSALVVARVGLATETDTIPVEGGAIRLPVRSTVPDDAQDVQDLRELAEFPRAWWPWLLLAAALAGLAAWWVYRRRNRPTEVEEAPAPEPEPETAVSEALRRLDALATAFPASADELAPFFDELSDVLRTYIARATGEHALEMTSSELVAALRSRRDVRAERAGEIDQLLRAADLVKFADFRPPLDRAVSAHGATRVAVERFEGDRRPALPLDTPESAPPDEPFTAPPR